MSNLLNQQKLAAQFLRAEVRNLEAASALVIKEAARKQKTEVQKQLRKNFKRGPNSSGSFFKAVKVVNLKPKGALGPAAYVRMGVPWVKMFQEGGVVEGKPWLVILLPTGQKMGYRRISKANPWKVVWDKIQRRGGRAIPTADGKLIVVPSGGAFVGAYKIQRKVQERKRLSFYESAEAIANEMPDAITRLLG
jgi:hypothetical protein